MRIYKYSCAGLCGCAHVLAVPCAFAFHACACVLVRARACTCFRAYMHVPWLKTQVTVFMNV